MDFFEEHGITRYINAHDTYTVYGGSRMTKDTLKAMAEISEHFVDFSQMQEILGVKTAQMTHNEGAFFTNGASGGLLLAACVCMARGSAYLYSRLPDTSETLNEIIVMRAQRNAYDAALLSSGAKIIEIGDADETLPFELEGRINEKTAAVFYFASTLYQRGSMSLTDTIAIAHKRKIPVVVDAAAQLPPTENLWNYTGMGADMVIFSGGKTLCGPQDSGLILGKKRWIEDCKRFGAPAHGICRSSKTSREAMAGLFTALKHYLSVEDEERFASLMNINQKIENHVRECRAVQYSEIVKRGPVGQHYPRLYLYLTRDKDAGTVVGKMRDKHIYIGLEKEKNAIYISPLNLNEEEVEIVMETLKGCL